MEGAVSGKTGFTGKAGYCYVGAVKKDEKLFIAALLDCGWPPHRTYKWQDMRKLVTYGDKNFEYKEIEKTGLGKKRQFWWKMAWSPGLRWRLGLNMRIGTPSVFCWETMKRSR